MGRVSRPIQLAMAAVAAAAVPGARGPSGPAPAPDWLALAAFAVALAGLVVLLVVLGWHARGLARHAARIEARARRVGRAAVELRDAAIALVPSQSGTRGEFDERCAGLGRRAATLTDAARRWKLVFRRGLAAGSRDALAALEREAAACEREQAELAERLAGVREELATAASYLAGLDSSLASLCMHVDGPPDAPDGGRGRFWCEDVRGRVEDARKALAAARADLAAGRTLEALRAGRRLRGRLGDMRRVLEARRASLAWLDTAAGDAARLANEVARLRRAGYNGLPVVPVAEIAEQARLAVAALRVGEPARAAEIQAALRSRLDGLRRATIGREECRSAVERRLEAAHAELALLQGTLGELPVGPVKRRYATSVWAGAARQRDRIAARAREVEMLLRQSAQANHLDVQAFEEAAALVGHAEAVLAWAHEEIARCAAAWRAPALEESRLQSRLAALHGQVGAAYARARALGLAPGPGIEGLLVAARLALHQEPVDLEGVRRPLVEAERVVARFEAHLDEVERADARSTRWRPGAVVFEPERTREPKL